MSTDVSPRIDPFRRISAIMAAGLAVAVGLNLPTSGLPDPRLSPGVLRWAGGSPIWAETVSHDEAAMAFFENRIRPLLVEHCYECHSAESGESSGGLRLDTATAIAAGGLSGPALKTGDSQNSLLMEAVRYENSDMQMPPDGKLDDDQIADLQHWIETGAVDPRGGEASEKKPVPMDRDPQSHWAFVTPVRQVPPDGRVANFPERNGSADHVCADPVDAWAVRTAREANLPLAPEADERVLVRRLYFDLCGTVPTLQQIQDYVASDRPDKFTRLVDQLIATPKFAERFARHWMDVSRYADTIGYALAGQERRYKGSHRYREWLVSAIAADMPYDKMILHQLAGDRTDPNNESGNLDAMGFLTLGRRFLNHNDTIDDRIDVITRGLLGMTVACARCHDHKFDPIPTTDYYSMVGIFYSSDQPEDAASPLALVDKNPHDERVFIRGQQGNKGEVAPRQFLTALRKPDEPRFSDGSGRLELANRIVADDNPLTARVMVNRVWQILIGQALVESTSDFGFRTPPPAVPGILDDLATDFADSDSLKKLVRRIVHSRIYRQSTDTDPSAFQTDPENRLLARANPRRRDFESLRDSGLMVADQMQWTLGGESVEISGSSIVPRRTLYAMIDRQNLPSLFRTFDFASPDTHSPGRYQTTVPQQGLYMMNSPQMIKLSSSVAEAVRRDLESANSVVRSTTSGMGSGGGSENSPSSVPTDSFSKGPEINALFRRVLSRQPNGEELNAFNKFLELPLSEFEQQFDPRDLWSYGLAKLDAESLRPLNFEPFAVFKDNRYQSAIEHPLPDDTGYAFLGTESGHAPRSSELGVVRRFIAPVDGELVIRSQMGHQSEQGDGVQADIWAGGERVRHQHAKSNNTPYGPHHVRVKEGQPIDFVVSPGKTDSFDSFFWRITLTLTGDRGQTIDTQSERDFRGTEVTDPTVQVDRLTQAAQILLMSNEFAFVD